MDTTQKIKDKWNQLHSNAGDRFPEPCTVLKNTSYLLPAAGTALDIACGLGGNALYLAQCGLQTTAIDISEVGIGRLQKQASLRNLSIQAVVAAADCDYFMNTGHDPFDVIAVSNYLDRDLFRVLPSLLKSEGLLFYQTFVKDKADPEIGPSNPQYLLDVNELLALTATLECRLFYDLGSTGQLTEGLRNQSCIIAQKE